MASEDAHELFLLIEKIGDDPWNARKDLVKRTLKNRGWSDTRVKEAIVELAEEGAVRENAMGDVLVRSRDEI